jgi:hypothetical protein
VFALARFIRVPGAHRPPQIQVGSRATRHHRSKNRLERIRKVLPSVCGIGLAAVTGVDAGGRESSRDRDPLQPITREWRAFGGGRFGPPQQYASRRNGAY